MKDTFLEMVENEDLRFEIYKAMFDTPFGPTQQYVKSDIAKDLLKESLRDARHNELIPVDIKDMTMFEQLIAINMIVSDHFAHIAFDRITNGPVESGLKKSLSII